MNQLFLQFSYLQVLDFMTTVAFLSQGIQEGNPLIRGALRYAPHPLVGLLMMKILAAALGFYCWRCGRDRLLRRMNVFFALLVTWNLAALILASAGPKIV